MSSQMSSFRRSSNDHFQPDTDLDPHTQRTLRGKLEQIDYIAYASNREYIEHALGPVDADKFQRLSLAAAQARARWAKLALTLTENGQLPSPQQIESLAQMRQAFEELASAYDGIRRLIERGYVTYGGAASAGPKV